MIIGFTGAAGSGKDTASDYLVSKYGFTKVSFAAILKNMLSVAGLPEPSNRDDKEKNVEGFDFTWRHAAQTLGTNWAREYLDKDIWVKLTMAKLDPNKDYVFSDVRFDNEAQAIRNAGGSNILLLGRSVDLGDNSTHASEQGITQELIRYNILNTRDIKGFHRSIDAGLESCGYRA
jgi:hypothetical protein